MFLFAHGAGAGMRHPFMEAVARRLAEREVATFRYQFPYMEKGSGRPDPPAVLLATVRATAASAGDLSGDLPLIAGGKSMGGRMTSQAAAEGMLPALRGLCFLGFPLHAAGRPSTERADHLRKVTSPMLFLQGTRDALADLERIRGVVHGLGGRARMHVLEGADHSFHVLKRSGRNDDEVLSELVDQIVSWELSLPASPRGVMKAPDGVL